MMKPYFLKMNNEEGTTLVELLAAITILTIIVLAFLAYFIQAGRTNNMTNEVNEATFLAQEEMERVTYLSSKEEQLPKDQTYKSNAPYTINHAKDPYLITTKIMKAPETNSTLFKVIVEVTEGGKNRAQMETRLPFEIEE